VKFVCGLMAISQLSLRRPWSSATATVVHCCPSRPLPSSISMSKIRTSVLYPLHTQISSAKFIHSLPIDRVPMPPGKSWIFFLGNSRTWKVLENHFGPGKSWKLKLKVFESPGKISLKVMHFSSG